MGTGTTCVSGSDMDATEPVCGTATNNVGTGVCGGCALGADGSTGASTVTAAPVTNAASTCPTGTGCCADGSCVTVGANCP